MPSIQNLDGKKLIRNMVKISKFGTRSKQRDSQKKNVLILTVFCSKLLIMGQFATNIMSLNSSVWLLSNKTILIPKKLSGHIEEAVL
jgi:hypothetical protein